jgi:chromosome segregation ATPase
MEVSCQSGMCQEHKEELTRQLEDARNTIAALQRSLKSLQQQLATHQAAPHDDQRIGETLVTSNDGDADFMRLYLTLLFESGDTRRLDDCR